MRSSVCLASYNGGAFLKRQVDSILSQLAAEDELIISDNGSSDRTLELLNEYKALDPRVVILHCRKKGVVANFAHALNHAQGEYVFLSDQDDIWEPNKYSVCIDKLEAGYELVVSNCQLIDANGVVTCDSYFGLRPPKEGVLANLYRNSFMGCCMAFRKRVLERALPFPYGVPMHDSWLGLVASTMGRVSFVDVPLVRYRRHESAVSTTGLNSRQSHLKSLENRIYLALALVRLTTQMWLKTLLRS